MVVSGCAAVGVTKPAHRHQGIADAAADGRANGAVLEIQRGGVQRALVRFGPALGGSDLGSGGERGLFDVGLVCLHGLFGGAQGGHGGVEILLGGGIGRDQGLQTFVVLLRLHQVGLGGGQARLRLQQRNLLAREIEIGLALPQVAARLLHAGFKRPQIEHVQDLAGRDLRARLEEPAVNVALHAAAHLHHVARVSLRGEIGKDGNVARLDFHHGDDRRRRAGRSAPLTGGIAALEENSR